MVNASPPGAARHFVSNASALGEVLTSRLVPLGVQLGPALGETDGDEIGGGVVGGDEGPGDPAVWFVLDPSHAAAVRAIRIATTWVALEVNPPPSSVRSARSLPGTRRRQSRPGLQPHREPTDTSRMEGDGGPSGLQAEFVMAGSRTAADVAAELSRFIGAAERSLDVAIYDFEAKDGASAAVGEALELAAGRGVAVRVAFNQERQHRPSAPRPPKCDPAVIDGLDVPTRGVHGDGTLMHHKYVVRDGASVWTGSMNWTDDAFGLEENVLLRLDSPEIATAYANDFRQLWDGGTVERSGLEGPEVSLAGGVTVRPTFSPRGPSLAHLCASVLGTARHRIRVLSPVITSGVVLGTLAEFAARESFDLVGAYDLTQMEEVR